MGQENDRQRYIEAGFYLFELIQSALSKTQPKEKPKHISWQFLYQLAKDGAVLGASFYGLEQLKGCVPEKWIHAWRKGKELAVYRQACFDGERQEIIRTLASEGISCMPLKGVVLLEDYPKPGMREMVDNDILYGLVETGPDGRFRICGSDREQQTKSVELAKETVHRVMTMRGYQKDEPGAIYHEEYLKKPIFNFEMHNRLGSPGIAYDYYENSWRFAVKREDEPAQFYMKKEDMYIYLMIHEYGHFIHGDSKIRFLIDLYVFLKKNERNMDWEYIQRELQNLSVEIFEQKMRGLLESLSCSRRDLTEIQKEIFYLLLDQGAAPGDVEARSVEGRMALLAQTDGKKRELLYLWKRICIPEAECRAYYPFFYRYRFLKPVLILYRLGRGIIWKRKKIIEEIRAMRRVKRQRGHKWGEGM